MDKATFLARVRSAAHAGRAYRAVTRDVPAGTGYVGAAGDLCERFASEVNAVGGQAEVVSDHTAACEALQTLLRRYEVRSALVWEDHAVLKRLGLHDLLAAERVTAHAYSSLQSLAPAEQRAEVLAADIGITSCEFAIAETGTLVMCSSPGRERMASLVPPVHVAIVEATQIVPDLFDVFGIIAPSSLPSNITLITGPSKTGDIELQLTIGVHGPKHWHVVVIRNQLH
jgi:L-lactate dehydrogenase complex protein LldG